ncbi:unnamed protein product [Psylliodes chrysocephalus]|uniref:Carboxylic ester hydrolase n=1 Tax=Psylliodes chrysocephalus TaxID=3402493 RepID=A0A9P0DBN0_9CUCU|nr:unnamed protein product [Psylliodes chrysocephala]
MSNLQVYCEDPIINLPNGKIRGQMVKSRVDDSFTFYSYQGIPFAAPPIGKYRFLPPQPVQNWDGIKDVFDNEVSCWASDKVEAKATEDCLYLSVYTPVAPTNNTKLNVLVFMYGGGFHHGHMSYGHKKSSFIVQNDIILVTFNYRGGPFGFLSTGDSVIPGNMGLKDQQATLKWVNQNIHLFGGDPDKVTLMGQSAGSASMTYHLLAPGSSGLFRAAVGCSGSAFCTWAYQRNAVDAAYGVAAEIDPSFTRNRSSEELLEFLQSVDAVEIVNTNITYNLFAPVIEVPHDGAFISENMYDNALNGNFNKVPVLMGINSEEGIGLGRDMPSFLQRLRSYDKNPRLGVNDDMYITDDDVKLQVGKEINRIYVGDGLLEDNPGKGIQMYSDDRYARAIIKFAELIARHVDVFFYQFSYHGELGKVTNNVTIPGIGKVKHAEDQRYFWSEHDDYSAYPKSDIITVARYNKLISNFVKTLNPTPFEDDLFQKLTWPKVKKNNYLYLDIDNDLTIQENPRNFSYSYWVDIFEKYVPKPFISY